MKYIQIRSGFWLKIPKGKELTCATGDFSEELWKRVPLSRVSSAGALYIPGRACVLFVKRRGTGLATLEASMPWIDGRESFSLLFAEHHRRVLLAAYRVAGNMADAEDVTQAVFLRLANASGPPANASSYLYRAGINGALDLLRRRKSMAAEPLDEAVQVAGGSSPEAEAANRQLSGLLRDAIAELPPRAAEMFTLRYLEGLANREIAELLGASQALVAVTLYQTRVRLRKRLEGLVDRRASPGG